MVELHNDKNDREIADSRKLRALRSRGGKSIKPDRGGEIASALPVCFGERRAGRGGGQEERYSNNEGKRGGSQIKIAWSKSRIGHLEFFRIRGEHEAGRRDNG